MVGVSETNKEREQRRAALARFLSQQENADVAVKSLHRLPGGFSYQTWGAEVQWRARGGHHRLHVIVRQAPRGGILEPYDVLREFRILHALSSSAVPVPRPLWAEPTGEVLGTPFYVVERIRGRLLSPWQPPVEPRRREQIGSRFTDTLAALHRFDWEARGLGALGIPADRRDPAADEIARIREALDRVPLRPCPILREAVEWLDERRPPAPVLTLNHGDYRLANILWRKGEIAAVLDWERAHIGDPAADVAYTRLAGIAGWCAVRGELAKRYAEQSGVPLAPERIHFYTVLEQVKAALVGLAGLRAFADGRSADARLVAIGAAASGAIAAIRRQIGIAR